jgi:hypothetical protein
MTPPTARVRTLTYERDGFRCTSCGSMVNLEWQHRESSGHGGRGKKAPVLTPADGITTCALCNPRYEGDMQPLALASGWKLRRNRLLLASEIPFWNRNTGEYWLPDTRGTKSILCKAEALELIAAGRGIT